MGDSLREKMKIGIIGGFLAPHFNEAIANQIWILSKELNAPVITFNDIGHLPFKKMQQYLILNMRFLDVKKNPILSFINRVFIYMIIKSYEKKFDLFYLPLTIDDRFLNYLNLKKCILILASIPVINNKSVERFVKEIAPKLHAIIAQSNKVKKQLIDLGVDSNKIHVVYPLIDLNKFKNTEPQDLNKFKIIFASAPTTEDIFEDKGVPLLLESFKEFIKYNDAILYIVWRGKCIDKLYNKINDLKLEDYIEIIDDTVYMPEMYPKSHITVIPYINLKNSPEIPLSGVESIACGRPLVTTDIAEIAEIVKRHNCGCVSKPIKKNFLEALEESKRNYQIYQKNCRKTAEEVFSINIKKFDEWH